MSADMLSAVYSVSWNTASLAVKPWSRKHGARWAVFFVSRSHADGSNTASTRPSHRARRTRCAERSWTPSGSGCIVPNPVQATSAVRVISAHTGFGIGESQYKDNRTRRERNPDASGERQRVHWCERKIIREPSGTSVEVSP